MSFKIFIHQEVGPLACNCYVVGDATSKHAIVIDPGGNADDLLSAIAERGLTITAIVATHAHFDHVLAAERLRAETGAPFHLHDDDRVLLDWMQESAELFLGLRTPPPPEVDSNLDEGDRLAAGAVELEVRHTPGHSPGSISLVTGATAFAGDTLFAGSVGRTDLPGGDGDALVRAVKDKLFSLPDDATVYPGHGPPTTIEREKRMNPFVGEGRGLWMPPG